LLLKVGERRSIRSGTQLPHPLKLATPFLQLVLVPLPSGDANSQVCEGGFQVEQFAADAARHATCSAARLSVRPSTRDVLAERTSIVSAQLDHALACPYYARSITTTPSKAARPNATHADDGVRDSSNPVSLLSGQPSLPNRSELTVPAVLKDDRARKR
jgi:hypothetical protein